MKNRFVLILAVAGGFLMAVPMVAHHSSSNYDRTHQITMMGTVRELEFVNPHVQIHIERQGENGPLAMWIAVSASPAKLYRAGWNSKTLKSGDHITVTGYAAKDGSRIVGVESGKIVGPDGKVLPQEAE